jgi:hypothetical protein
VGPERNLDAPGHGESGGVVRHGSVRFRHGSRCPVVSGCVRFRGRFLPS